MNIGKQNLLNHMSDELDYFRDEDPERYEELLQYFTKVEKLLGSIND